MSDEVKKPDELEGTAASTNEQKGSDTPAVEAQDQARDTDEVKLPEAGKEGTEEPNSTASPAQPVDEKPEGTTAEDKTTSSVSASAVDPELEAKRKAAAEAREARARERAAKAAEEGGAGEAGDTAAADPDAEAKRRAEAREARARERAARAAGKEEAQSDEPKAPSPNQPLLDRIAAILKENVAEDAIEQALINERDGHRPVLVIKNDYWRQCATILKEHTELGFHYLRNVTGVDYESHLEVDYFLLSMLTKQECMVKIKTDRENPSVQSATPVWATANWNEREIYDLLGIPFSDHPDLRRIMLSDDWVGHPLRKDYEPYDPEV